MKKIMILAVAAGFSAMCPAGGGVTVLDELMPIPAKIERLSGSASAAALGNVSVIKGAVSGAPAATADEAYVIEIGPDGAKVTAPGEKGERWARVTLGQLVRLAEGRPVPCCRITDWPYLKWRGCMLDNSRNYVPPQQLKDFIDMMSAYKLNMFHWHLTENYAWRLESKKYPQLQSDRAFFYRHKGKYYTQEEFKDIVDYAYARGVIVMPELDVPGHAFAFRRAFGFKTMSDPGVGETMADLFDELCRLAPKEKMPFIHVGTDEVWKRELEGATREALDLIAKTISDHGRAVVSWTPGETYTCPGPRINMLWTGKSTPDVYPGPYFDACGMYVESIDPFEMFPCTVYRRVAKWHEPGELNLGGLFCAWHDGFVGLPYENFFRNQNLYPSCVLFGNTYWRGRPDDYPQYRRSLPKGGDPMLNEACEIERRVIAQRDKVLKDLRYPFHFLRQTDMRWRVTQADGTLVAKDIAQATITFFRNAKSEYNMLPATNGTVIAETWIWSPKAQEVGAWIGFTDISRDHGILQSAPLPKIGEWNRFGATAELNGEKIAPPTWKRPGVGRGEQLKDWTDAWKLYEADEEPFTDQEYYMRPPTQIRLKKGWNHVKLTVPNPRMNKGGSHRWVSTFIPVAGATDHPHEVPGLRYSSEPQQETCCCCK